MVTVSVRHGDAREAVSSPTLANRPLFGKIFSSFGQIIWLHSQSSGVVFILPSMAKAFLRLFCHSFLPLMAKESLPFSERFCLCWENRHCLEVNWNRVVIPTAFIKFGPIEKLHSSFGQNQKPFGKLGAFGFSSTASIKSGQIRKASYIFG